MQRKQLLWESSQVAKGPAPAVPDSESWAGASPLPNPEVFLLERYKAKMN